MYSGVASVDQRVPQPRKGFRPEPLVSGQQRATGRPGRISLAPAPPLGFADDPLADLGEHVIGQYLAWERANARSSYQQGRSSTSWAGLQPPTSRHARPKPPWPPPSPEPARPGRPGRPSEPSSASHVKAHNNTSRASAGKSTKPATRASTHESTKRATRAH